MNIDKIQTLRQKLKENSPDFYLLLKQRQIQRLSLKRLSLGEQEPTIEETLFGNTALQQTPEGT
jgi:hypothetical protein